MGFQENLIFISLEILKLQSGDSYLVLHVLFSKPCEVSEGV